LSPLHRLYLSGHTRHRSQQRNSRPPRRSAAIVLIVLFISSLALSAAAANIGWVRGNIRLNLRAGAGTQFKIIAGVQTGDELRVLSTGESWTRVETSEGKVGFIPAGYLETEPPPTLRLALLETETTTLKAELDETRNEAARLRESNATLGATDSGQREEIESLKIDNYELRAGTRYQEWITGALILTLGMLVGAVLHRNATRRPSSRIRL
jgi:SH3 domain protein